MRGAWDRLRARERRLRKAHGLDLADPSDRRRAWLSYQFLDHAILRHLWTNFAPVAPGVFRSNHPTHANFVRYKAMGIRTVLNLRGAARHARYLFEEESCAALGLTLVSVGLSARKAPDRAQVLALFDLLRSVERPVLLHCKSGADRAGFASALYLLSIGRPMSEARQQLSPRFLHFRHTKTGILDHILDLYDADRRDSGIGIEEWFATAYDATAAQAGFRR